MSDVLEHVSIRLHRELLAIEDAAAASPPGVGPTSLPDDVPPSGGRPEIMITTDLAAVTDAAERALLLYGGIYVRGRQLVRVVRDRGSSDWLRRPDGMPVILPITRDHLVELLARAATWLTVRETKRGLSTQPATPPMRIAAMLLERGEWILPQLESISDTPVFRSDGTIHDEPGYDAATRVIFDPCGIEFPSLPSDPTQGDASDALAELLEPFREFPLVAECDRAAVVALILSVIGRAAIDGSVPMFSSQAPTPGSGKGLLIDVVAMIATGRRAPLMAPTDDDEETRKRLLAIALESPAMVVIDNVEGTLGSASLAMALTAGQVSDRQLGSTKMVTASLRPVWCCTGNNVQLRGDLGRRVVPIDLDPRCEHPEDRVFERGDLLGWVAAARPQLVIAALTILRAYVLAGRPAHGRPPKGSFESWDSLIRGALLWAGSVDPLGGVARIREQSDDDLERLRALLVSWHDAFGSAPMSIADAVRHSEHNAPLRDALAVWCRSGRPEARSLGYVMRARQGRPVAGLVLRRSAGDRNGIAKWLVEGATRQ